MSSSTTRAATRPKSGGEPGWFDRWFQITERGSSVGREVRGGLTTFMAMAYIIALNPLILSGAKDVNGESLSVVGVTTMTAFSAFVATLVMGALGRVPLALAAALTVNAVVAYQIAPQVTWPQAMGLVVIQGLVIVLLAASGVRTMIMNAIPLDLKHAIGVGLGLFIALIGLVNAGFVTRRPDADGTSVPVTLGQGGVLKGWPIVVFVVGMLIIIALWARKIPGSVLLGVVVATVLAIIIESTLHLGSKIWGVVTPAMPEKVAQAPDFSLFGQVDVIGAITQIGFVSLIVFVFTLVLSGFFDAMGTVIAVSDEAGLVDKDGQLPGIGRVLSIDGAAATFGGITSSSANTVFVESAAGVGDGARTGLASVVTGGMFGLAMFFAPLATVIPQQAAAPALVLVGGLMCAQAKNIDWKNTEIAIPAFLILAITPFTYSVTAGVGAGVIAYVVIKAVNGKWREPGWLLWIVSLVFVAYFGIHTIERLVQ
ncbi:NCS2 family permease [Stackebrandtia nassauensis]|uniref:Xanthine/uracil/vitamin C permease n=1 Tax=Stackebrandtia nassauensis (strain DSM 44728 / CIP 108903 / NRRL B-16338 / NBRC 102104 / LLR-40K-21) TaxID=446470 RepID=D3Q649_STANL|nr:NCS2 family permease [Stackebrandtia nassauensis]ADD42224.1 Xanthine/uracil/vitamin C permease [Stackebrandtia nassauensis DSM 44728]